MPSLSVFGAQWGDEGKGKIIDLMAGDADIVVRYQGGANAGHTVVVGETQHVLHLIPSGILQGRSINVIANGVAIDPIQLLKEVDELRGQGIAVSPDNLRISSSAHVIFEHHQILDRMSEVWLGEGRIGTTGRGIGPCYADKASRTGLRVSDLMDPERCRTRLRAALAEKNAQIERVYEGKPLALDSQIERYVEVGRKLAPFVCDTGALLRAAYREGRNIVIEGAQGVMLDVDHGTYPYVTSSNTCTLGIPAATGMPPQTVDRAVGIAKAYCTRVGEGPFPSELEGSRGDQLQKIGREFGATTGRPRRCGWFDAVAVRYALELNGADGWILTKLDVLSELDEIEVVVSYRVDGVEVKEYPADRPALEGVEVVTEKRPGWKEDICSARTFGELPQRAVEYVAWLEELVGVGVEMISVGPEREQVLRREG